MPSQGWRVGCSLTMRRRDFVWRALRRGFHKRCPHCGLGPLYIGWTRHLESCQACGLVEVIADPHVRRRGLGNYGLQRGMGIEHRHDGQPRAVARARDADASIVIRHIRQKPLNRVVGIGAFVDRLRVRRTSARTPACRVERRRASKSSSLCRRAVSRWRRPGRP